MNSLDDLELELRKLPGVKAAGFDQRDDVLLVQLHLGDRVDSAEHPVPVEASRIVARHIDERAAVEIVRWRTIPAVAVAAPPPPVIDVETEDTAAVTQPDVAAEPAGEPVPEPAAEPVEAPARRARLLAVLASPTPTSSRCISSSTGGAPSAARSRPTGSSAR